MWKRWILSLIKPSNADRNFHTSKILQEAKLIDGKKIAGEILQEVKQSVDSWVQSGMRRPKLVALLVGEDPASTTYVNNKMKAAKSVGIDSETILCPYDVAQAALIERIQLYNVDPLVDGVLVQLPLPKGINEKEICHAVTPSKDVDGFHSENIGNLSSDKKGIVPATALGVKELIIRTKVETFGKNAVVIGRSKHVGLPIALLLHADGNGETGALDMTTTICHRHTSHVELKKFTILADVLVAAAGVPGLVTKDMVKPGACVIDVGITRVKDARGKFKLTGDVDFDGVKQVAGHITPVPGGVGPMTVAILMQNTLFAAKRNQQNK
ncbi:bifunctional methylenetetrahydrofolate dehydrogenase/cyclohydrolase, mitochondrial [Neodiprion fabricii]|uniref:bifunctional methylenetetrahydrofolate dehydrogenase/cyclohydrolase, mitochondrial n=1 Tax=Neodiprion fabricii TaxID=2872261 RepID=UPI001ED96D98|nr:bifunctional methylenetetrahydrofolate dehydrogenase/cyclohydrolase, mitochondrial [Neodiprion fabricii]